LRSEDGYPYASVVDYMPVENGDVVMLLSRLAEHQKYLSADPRASLLIAPGLGKTDMLAEARVTLLGEVTIVEDKSRLRPAYLACHPQAENYIDFTDFLFYRFGVKQVRYIAGFGRMGWLQDKAYAAR
jgi:putative heme iron utilization protein